MDLNETDLGKLILRLNKESDTSGLSAIWFLLKKMEYTAKKKFNANSYIEQVESMLTKPKRGYNPTMKVEN